jgi:hypothetical protein
MFFPNDVPRSEVGESEVRETTDSPVRPIFVVKIAGSVVITGSFSAEFTLVPDLLEYWFNV